MLVKEYMTHHPIMVDAGRRVVDAQRLMAENKISHLLVVGDGKRLQGMVTRERLAMRPSQLESMNVWELSDYLGRLTVGKVMIPLKELVTVSPQNTIEEAADLMIRRQISGLPVVEDGMIVCGIITQTDLLIELRNLLGAIESGWRVVMRVPDRNGEFRKLVQVISSHNWGIMAFGCVRSPRHPDHWDIMLKVRYCTREELLAALQAIDGQTLVDLRETTVHK